MDKLNPGDCIVCGIRGGHIASPLSSFDEEKDFEIIAKDYKGYFLYVPEYYNMADTIQVSAAHLKSLEINKKFLNCPMFYILDEDVLRVRRILDGKACSDCKQFYPFAQANQEDGKMICWPCRSYPFYK